MKNIIICTIKTWNIQQAENFREKYKDKYQVTIIKNEESFTYSKLTELNPDYIFFPHWSCFIPAEVYNTFTCIVFHMTDLPFGRGGSPLQNLIVRGIKKTKITAIKVEKGIDSGDVYLKKDLDLSGSATAIFQRAAKIIFHNMIPYILETNPVPVSQSGLVVEFKRRTPEESELLKTFSLETIYNYIRMLDAEGYPKAFLTYGDKKLIFSNAFFNEQGKLMADVEFIDLDDIDIN